MVQILGALGLVGGGFFGCADPKSVPVPSGAPPAIAEAPRSVSSDRDEIPPSQLSAVIMDHYRAVGAMERYEYKAAVTSFEDVCRRAPGWITGKINLGIALLNSGGEAIEQAKKSGQGDSDQAAVQNIETARNLFDAVLARQPDHPHALFSRGIILQSQGDLIAAHRDFARVTQIDPHDANSWFEYAETLTDPLREGMPASRNQAPELILAYTKALEANPYLVTAMFGLQRVYNITGDRDRAAKIFALFKKLNTQFDPAASGEKFALTYGEMGKYAQIIDPFRRPEAPQVTTPSPRWGMPAEVKVTLAPGDRWTREADFQGELAVIGRARRRFGEGMSTFDVNRDGLLDLYLTAAIIGPNGIRDILLVNRGNGQFHDQTAAYGLPLDRASLGVAASDFDADLQVDLYLTGVGSNLLLRQSAGKFVDVTATAGVGVVGAISLTARWLDIDQDGDLDLYVLNHAPLTDRESAFKDENTGRGIANSVFRNDGKPAVIGFRPESNLAPVAVAPSDLAARDGLSIQFSTSWPTPDILSAGATLHSAIAALDIDNDRDLDLVITADDAPPRALLNDRAGQWHTSDLNGWNGANRLNGLLVTQADKDGRSDLVATAAAGPASVWLNATERVNSQVQISGRAFPLNARHWRSAATVDLDLDTRADLIGLPEAGSPLGIEWARNTSARYETRPVPLGPLGADNASFVGLTAASLVGNPLPDLIFRRNGEPPRCAENLGNGQHWLAIDLAGRWKTSHDQMRSNSEGLGVRLSLEGQGLYVPFDYTTPQASTGQSVGPFVLGLGAQLVAPLLRIRWPDGVFQAELNVTGDQLLTLSELNRKTGSCPILFTWNGERFVCIGDFAGAAGLGFLEAPNEFHPPDRDEALAIRADQLQLANNRLCLSINEPMDEVAYLDHLTLDIVDRPQTTAVGLDERFTTGGSPPTGQILAWSESASPLAASDDHGCDVLDAISRADRVTAHHFERLQGWVGYAQDHSLILDFSQLRLDLASAKNPILCLTGWVEYPYSQTNYAAAGAGLTLRPPTLEQQLPSGAWQVIEPALGYPAGLTRMMTANLHGKLVPGSPPIFRIKTNLECYWDQAFLALADPSLQAEVRITTLPVAHADLHDRGYLRESSPDGLDPQLPDHAQVAPMPLARFRGELTRFGEVTQLLHTDDDHLCVLGPGDEVRLEFDGSRLPTLPTGWTRSYVFRSVAYCKDHDPFTATSDTVGPLPWRGMSSFPLPPGGERPVDPSYAEYLRIYQTRPAGER